MGLVRLVYYSENRLDPNDGPMLGALQELLATSRRNNARRGVTGGLAFDDMWFFQALEGERDAVWSAFRTILRDPRHDAVMLVESVPVEARRFAAWSMRMARRGAHFDRFLRGDIVRPELMTGSDIVEALDSIAPAVARGRPLVVA